MPERGSPARVHYAAPQIGAPLNRLRSVPAPSISRRAAPAGTRSGNEIRFNEPDGLISARKKTRRLHKFLDTTLLQSLYARGLTGQHLQLIVTDGCPGLDAALQVVYPRVSHQRCWVHKMRNILEKVKQRDYDAVKTDAQAIYRSDSRADARHAFFRFRKRWFPEYPAMVRQLERDLPDLLAFYSFPKPLWRKLRTTNLIERVFVEVRRRTRPMVCFVNVASVDRIIYSIFQHFNLEWATAPSAFLHKPLDITETSRRS